MNDDDLKTQLHEMHKKVNLNPDQAQTFVGKKFGPKFLQMMVSADNKKSSHPDKELNDAAKFIVL